MTNIYQKIANVQKKIGSVQKTGTNPHFKNTYVELGPLLDALELPLEEEGLILMQPLSNVNGRPALKTVLKVKDSDEIMEEAYTLPDLPNAQQMMGAVTYTRRYSIMSLFKLKDVDDDGNAAVPAKKATTTSDNDLDF